MALPYSIQESDQDDQQQLLNIIGTFTTELHRGSLPTARVTLDASLDRELGLDSLARVELFSRIEQHFNAAIPESLIAEAQTPRDLLRGVRGATRRPATIVAAQSQVETPSVQAQEPKQASTLLDVLDWHAAQHGTRVLIRFFHDDATDDTLSYHQLAAPVRAVAAALQNRGVQHAQTVAIMLPTGRDYFFAFLAILFAGGIPVPIYPPARPSQFEDHLKRHAAILNNCQATLLITVPEAARVARLLKAHVTALRGIVTLAELMGEPASYQPVTVSAQDTAFIQYTSGSTGTPKGVVLSHANLLANIRAMGERVAASAEDVFVSWLPLYHDMGLIGAWLGSLYYGSSFVVMSPLSFLARPQRWLWAIHRYRGTLSAAPNFGYELCLNKIADSDIQGLDLSSWRAAFNGAEAVSPETVARFGQRFSPYGFRPQAMMPVYGLAENTVGLAFPACDRGPVMDRIRRHEFTHAGLAVPAPTDDANALRFIACGHVLAGHELRVVDEFGRELPDRREGRLQFRGTSATSGYLRNATATRELFDGEWLNSGDLAYLVDGEVYPTGRTKDIIIRAGRNLYPHELEESIGNIPGIRKGRVAVFGVTDTATATERLVVLAETRENEADILTRLRTEINSRAMDLVGGPPDEIILAPPNTVLKTSSGKIRRSACRELFEKGRLGRTPFPSWFQLVRLRVSSLGPQWRRLAIATRSYLFQLYATTCFYLLALPAWLLVVLSPIESWRWKAMRVCTRTLSILAALPIRVDGRENLPSIDQPCIYVANHASYLDGPILIVALQRVFSFVAKAELAKAFISGLFLRRIGTQFVERFDVQKGVQDAAQVATIAAAGRSLLFFPEGTFTRHAGLLPFHMGAFLTAARHGLPILPVAIRGSRQVLRGDEGVVRRGMITVSIGKPILCGPAQAHDTVWRTALMLRDGTHDYILRHCGEMDSVAPATANTATGAGFTNNVDRYTSQGSP